MSGQRAGSVLWLLWDPQGHSRPLQGEHATQQCRKLLSLHPVYHHHLPQTYFFQILPFQVRSAVQLEVLSI